MKIELDMKSEGIQFNNHSDLCIGTGRMGLALQENYQKQLRYVQETIGFKYIRGHGLFSDDMAIYHEYQDKDGKTHVEYNFTYLDLVMDFYQEIGLKPYLELGFMPEELASGTQTVFYWKGQVTPPRDYQKWTDLVVVTLQHLMERYGEDEVLSWPIEVWNEPNLPGFWENADMEEYFKLFEVTFKAIKGFNPKFKVGGPAVCGGVEETWQPKFLEFCRDREIALDYFTRHFYTIDQPTVDGHYSYTTLRNPDESLEELTVTRQTIESFDEFKGLPIHITEFNTSYRPDTPLHDTNLNAAYVAYLLSRLGDTSQLYSYWTFGDVFEEMGVPFTPFHGGFGLVANGNIPKPTYWTFYFFKQLYPNCIYRDNNVVITTDKDKNVRIVYWNFAEESLKIHFKINGMKGMQSMIHQVVNPKTTNPRKVWHDLGEPASLNKEHLTLIKQGAQPKLISDLLKDGDFEVEIKSHEIGLITLKSVKIKSDRGFYIDRI